VKVTVFEKGDDYMSIPTFNPNRSYTIDITGHGAKAMEYINASDRMDKELIKFNGMRLRFKGLPSWDERFEVRSCNCLRGIH
jgi:kynurenine 3-monooxygenase